MAINVTISQISEASGAKLIRLKHLAKKGVFLPINDDERPTNGIRRYSMDEAAIACIVVAIDNFKVNYNVLKNVAKRLREFNEVPKQFGLSSREQGLKLSAWVHLSRWRTVEKRISEDDYFEALKKQGWEEPPVGEPPNWSNDDLRLINQWVHIEEAKIGKAVQLSIAVGDDDSWEFWLDRQPSRKDNVQSYFVVNLDQVLAVLR